MTVDRRPRTLTVASHIRMSGVTRRYYEAIAADSKSTGRQGIVFIYGPPTNCYVAYTVIRRKIVFICSASYAVYTVMTRKIGFM